MLVLTLICCFPLVTIENAYAAIAHAPNQVTRGQEGQKQLHFGMLDADLLIHYATSVALSG